MEAITQDFELVYEHLEPAAEDGTVKAVWPDAEVEDGEQAEKHLRALGHWRRREAEINAHAKTEQERIEAWRIGELDRIAPRIAWHEAGLAAYMGRIKDKTVRLINGTIKRIAGRDRVEVQNFDALKAWCVAAGKNLVRIKEEPDKVEIAKHIKATGELPDGVDVVTGEDSIKIEVS